MFEMSSFQMLHLKSMAYQMTKIMLFKSLKTRKETLLNSLSTMKYQKFYPSLFNVKANAFGVILILVKNQGFEITNQYVFLFSVFSLMVQYSDVLGVERAHQSILNIVVKLYYTKATVGEIQQKIKSLTPLIVITLSI